MEIQWSCKEFSNLTKEELCEIFHLRIAVFIIEQNCPYQDVDGKDLKSLHVQGRLNGKLVAYTRIVLPGVSYKEISIGRVLTSIDVRRNGTGKVLMNKSMEYIKEKFGAQPIRIGAQEYLKKFYKSFGFIKEGDGYLEDGIPHIIMLYSPK